MVLASPERASSPRSFVMYSQLLMKDLGDDARSGDANTILTAAHHLMKLINDLLDFSRLEAGRLTLHMETFPVSELAGEMTSLLKETAAAQGNRLETVGAEAAGKMMGDKTRVRQCLFNLLSNACKFTQGGTITLDLARVRRDG